MTPDPRSAKRVRAVRDSGAAPLVWLRSRQNEAATARNLAGTCSGALATGAAVPGFARKRRGRLRLLARLG
eukprot:12371363-Alexandrium_andersonii.AAC.1